MPPNSPVVSVLMPVYNAEAHVQEAIQSILNQTFTDFELLIFNDGSTDESGTVIQRFKDERIRFFDYTQNSGYVTHLNKGLQVAEGVYIARMDADDIAMPDRFAQQVALLEREPAVVLCGTAFETFGSEQATVEVPLTDQDIRNFMLFNSPMGHPTVMFRKAALEQPLPLRYDENYMPAEDYKLWYDLSKVGELRNLPTALLKYRVHQKQISAYKNHTQRQKANAVRVFLLLDQGFKLSDQEQKAYSVMAGGNVALQEPIEAKRTMAVMQSILRQNAQLQAYDPQVLIDFFQSRWLDLSINLRQFDPSLFWLLLKPTAINAGSLFLRTRLAIKALVSWQTK